MFRRGADSICGPTGRVRRRVALCVGSLALLTAAVTTAPTAAHAAPGDIWNELIAASVTPDGRFTVGVLPDPASGNPVDASWSLTYQWPGSFTSFSSVRIDGVDSVIDGLTKVSGPTAVDRLTNRTVWKSGDIEITQTLQIVPNTATGVLDVVQISYTVANTGGSAHSVGTRLMVDTDVNNNDAAPFRVPGNPPITTERTFAGAAIPSAVEVFDDIADTTHVGSIQPIAGAVAPDVFQLASWPGIYATVWDYTTDPTQTIGDSAYAVYWNPRSLAAGESQTFASNLGLAGVVGNTLPPLTAALTGPARLSFVNGAYQPNPFAVQATLRNDGSSPVTGVTTTLNLPPQLSLVPGADNTAARTVGSVAAGQEVQLSWNVRATLQQFDTTVVYSLGINSSNKGSKTLSRNLVLSGIPGEYIAVNPVRMADTRTGDGIPKARVGPRATVTFLAAGTRGIPVNARSVVLNVTGIGPSADTYVTVWPSGDAQPNTSNLNLRAGDVAANLVIAKVGADGKVAIYNDNGDTDVAVDAMGYFLDPAVAGGAGSKQHGLAPARIVDTRIGQGAPAGQVTAGGTLEFAATGVAGVPATATAVILNVTGIAPQGTGGYLTVFPTGAPLPNASNLNLVAEQVRPNLVIAKVGAGGKVSVYNAAGPLHLAIDVQGYFSPAAEPGAGQVGIVPQRSLDTRTGVGIGAVAKVGAGQSISVRVAGTGLVPTDASSVVLNVTAVGPSAPGYLTVWPTGGVRPVASNVNFAAGEVVPNHVVAKVGAGGYISIFNESGSVDVLVDVMGYFA